jgi:hypothetical protein
MSEEKRYAILIGNNRFRPDSGLLDLRCPENDVDTMDEVLRNENYGGFTETVVLKNSNSYEAIERMGEVFDQAGRNDLVLVYYSGHGKLDIEGQLYLAAQNTKTASTLSLSNTAIAVETIRKNIRQSKSNKVILILDCCYSGAVDEAFQRGADPSVPLQTVSKGQGIFILTASTKTQTAQEKEGDTNGLLTKHIIEGIKSGNADVNGDGLIDVADLYSYVNDMVCRESLQEPMRFALDAKGKELIVARAHKLSTSIDYTPVTETRLHSVDLRKLEAVGGAMPLDSPYYVVRHVDDDFLAAIEKRERIVLVKGARQIGKTSLLARGLEKARETGAQVATVDFQNLNFDKLKTIDDFFSTLATLLIKRLGLGFTYKDCWDGISEGSENFRDFAIRALNSTNEPMVWGMDEVDRLFSCDYGSEVFGLFRSFHNARASEPRGPWKRLTLAMAYATEARLFIKDQNQSPFNVGVRLELSDFSANEVEWLNRKLKNECGLPSPPLSETDAVGFYGLLNGHPFLVRVSLDAMVRDNLTWKDFKEIIIEERGLFGEHLRRILELLHRDEDMRAAVVAILKNEAFPAKDSKGNPFPIEDILYRLESSGLMSGKIPKMKPRCQLYEIYLKRHLL